MHSIIDEIYCTIKQFAGSCKLRKLTFPIAFGCQAVKRVIFSFIFVVRRRREKSRGGHVKDAHDPCGDFDRY